MSLGQILTLIMLFAYFVPHSLVAQTFKDNGKWGLIKANSYNVVLFKNGQFEVDIKDTLKFRVRFAKRSQYRQNFPEIKFLRANLKNNGNKTIEATYKYLWDGGTVEETLLFDSRSISVSYSFLPWATKNTRLFTCLLTMRTPEKKGMKLVAMDRKGLDGALSVIDKWKPIHSCFRMTSLQHAGPYVVDVISEGKAWINIWGYPNMAVIKNAKKRMWDNTVYQKDETYKIEYLIYISRSNGKTVKDSELTFQKEVN